MAWPHVSKNIIRQGFSISHFNMKIETANFSKTMANHTISYHIFKKLEVDMNNTTKRNRSEEWKLLVSENGVSKQIQ